MITTTIIVAIAILAFVRIVPATVRVIDGDTIVVKNRKWRLAGYDAPEYDQPGGRQASTHLRKILAEGHAIAILSTTDAYGRRVAFLITRRGPVAWRMILTGWGHPVSLIGSFLKLRARISKRGIWNGEHSVISPALWREMTPDTRYSSERYRRRTNLHFSYDKRRGLKLPGGFILP